MTRAYPSPKHADYIYRMLIANMPGEHHAHTKSFFTVLRRAAQDAFNVKVRLVDLNEKIDGDFNYLDRTIRLRKGTGKLVSTLCHELCHVYCYEYELFAGYHRKNNDHPRAVKLATKAEIFVDKMGEQVFKKLFPSEEYPVCLERRHERKG